RRLGDVDGRPLGVSDGMAAIAAGMRPPALSEAAFASYRSALAVAGVSPSEVAGLAAFTTGDPTAGMARFRDDLLALHPPPPRPAAGRRQESSAAPGVTAPPLRLPHSESGRPPFANAGGDWLVDAAGRPILQRSEEASLFATVPRAASPDGGFPTVVFVRAG